MAGPLNYTTKVPPHTSVAEVQRILAEHGADAIAVIYQDRRPAGVTFQFRGNAFSLPADVDAMAALLAKNRPNGGVSLAVFRSREHAERVTWRVVKDWLEAQMALVAAQQVSLDEVMLPYLVVDPGSRRTLREDWQDRLALPSGGSR